MTFVVTRQMQALFADAWWGEHDRQAGDGREDNEECDRAGLQAVLDWLWAKVEERDWPAPTQRPPAGGHRPSPDPRAQSPGAPVRVTTAREIHSMQH